MVPKILKFLSFTSPSLRPPFHGITVESGVTDNWEKEVEENKVSKEKEKNKTKMVKTKRVMVL